MKRIATGRVWLVAALATTAVAAGCGGDDKKSSAPDVRANGTDAAFVKLMIPHHEASVDAADLALSRAEHPQLKKLAQDMVQQKSVELATLRSVRDVLQEAGVEEGDLGLSEEEQGIGGDPAELRDTKDFDCVFLDTEIPHGEGAARIARAELESGIHAELRRMSENIIDAEAYELRQMRRYATRWCSG